MRETFETREEIQSRVRGLCEKYYADNFHELKLDKQGNSIVDRGFVKSMFGFVCEAYSSKVIIPQYTGKDLWYICCIGETMLDMCDKYSAIPNFVLLAKITGVGAYTYNKIYNTADRDLVARLDLEYDQDYRIYFKRVYNETKERNFYDKINLATNIEHSYPVYCLLNQIKEYEKDGRIERGRLGDITQLNAPIEAGGFGFAHPTIQVDNRQLIIGDETKLLNVYAFADKRKNNVEITDKESKQELKEEAIDLFREENIKANNTK